MQKSLKITEALAHGYSSESTQRELSNEYQHDRVQIVIKNLCILVLWMRVTLALKEGLSSQQKLPKPKSLATVSIGSQAVHGENPQGVSAS